MDISEFIIRRARTGDGESIARLMVAVEAPLVLPFTIWSSPLASAYVEDLIEGECSELAADFYILRSHDEILAALYIRLIDGAIFVDNIYATETARKQQLTNLLIYRALIDYSQRHPSDTVAFDAFEFDRTIRAWHRYLGGKEKSRRAWWRVPLPVSPLTTSLDSEILDLEEAERRHQRWGFSLLRVATARGTYAIGRLPKMLFRLTDPAGLSDSALLETLAALDRSRDLFVTTSVQTQPAGTYVTTSIRSAVDITCLLKRLLISIPSIFLEEATNYPSSLLISEPPSTEQGRPAFPFVSSL
jgi:hypothetical protein